ncbi:serine/threonine-protein kinase [Kitasatospora kifunensis]|uniref:non-specific serine/threonine protein kinase n=1 Tax=Kitasatospora kifunensis TaxID=58351 RepID=A0A7W7VX53_KITKI|nr:protein kinase [Kitasatospora kifunensis]MBB4925260.1 serine/threonine protein kinase [Kitasatospora kifunensis]
MSGHEQAGAATESEQAEPIAAAATRRMLAGRYELGDRLGRGGMGTVWRARDLMLDREVAVKELTVDHLPEEDLAILQSRMKQEARAAARIKHAGVITIHDVLEQDGRPWIVMELIDGRSLADVVAQDGPLSPREAAEVGAQVLAALHRGHQLGVLHRDVKPANVLLEHGTGRAVLLDFGIAKFEGSSELTRPGDLVGSPDYLAPERAQGERPGPASDLWGLGATLYTAVEGQSPFRRYDPLSTLAAVVSEPLPEPRNAGALGPVLAALMTKQAAGRPSADEALQMLREVTAGHTIGITTRPPLQRVPTQVVPVVDRLPVQNEPEQPAWAAAMQPPVGPPPAIQPPAMQPPVGPTAATMTRAQAPTPQATAVVPISAQPAPRRRRRGLRVLLVGLTVAVVSGAVAFGVVQLEHRGTPAADPSSAVSPTSSASPSSPVTSSPTGTAVLSGPAPAGYTWQSDPSGFRFPLPLDGGTWQRTTDDKNQIYYSPDNKRHFLQFAVTVGDATKPYDNMLYMEGKMKANSTGYHRVSLDQTPVRGHEAARLVWTYNQLSGPLAGRRMSIDEEYRDADGTSYAILVSGPDTPDDTTTTQQRLTAILNGFTPTAQSNGAAATEPATQPTG